MKRFILILFSLWVVWTQTPLASRCDASGAALKPCVCCTGCGGSCGCVAAAGQDPIPLPLAVPSASIQTELLFPATPGGAFALPLSFSVDNFLRSPAVDAPGAVPLFRRDCALLL